jgi:hypothetical protein
VGNFSWPYQAKVMKILEIKSKMMGASAGQVIGKHPDKAKTLRISSSYSNGSRSVVRGLCGIHA